MTLPLPSYDPADNRQVDIPVALIPLLGGLISRLETYEEWEEGDEEAGRQISYLLQERLVT